MSRFIGQTYMYPTPREGLREIGVVTESPGSSYAVCWIAENGYLRLMKSMRLPTLQDPVRLQKLLDVWAKERKLKEVAK